MKNDRYNTHVPSTFPIKRAIMKHGKARKTNMPAPPTFFPHCPPRHALKSPLAHINVWVWSLETWFSEIAY